MDVSFVERTRGMRDVCPGAMPEEVFEGHHESDSSIATSIESVRTVVLGPGVLGCLPVLPGPASRMAVKIYLCCLLSSYVMGRSKGCSREAAPEGRARGVLAVR